MGVMLFPSSWLGNASRGGGGGGGGVGGWCILCTTLPVFLSFFLHLFYTSPPLFYTSPLFFSFPSFFFLHSFLICFFFFLSPLSPSFSPPSCLLFIMSFSFVSLPPLSLLSTAFSSVPVFFFLRELLVLCALRELLVLCALRGLLVLYAV